MDAFKKFGETIENLVRENFNSDNVMEYLNSAFSKLEGSGMSQQAMEQAVQEGGKYYSAQGFMMVMQTAFMKYMINEMNYKPNGGGGMDYGMYLTVMTAVQRITGRLQSEGFDDKKKEEYLTDAGVKQLLEGDNESWGMLIGPQFGDASKFL